MAGCMGELLAGYLASYFACSACLPGVVAMSNRFLVYGVTGYTGELVLRYCQERGLNPIIAGRDSVKVEKLAKQYGFESRSFPLTEGNSIVEGHPGDLRKKNSRVSSIPIPVNPRNPIYR